MKTLYTLILWLIVVPASFGQGNDNPLLKLDRFTGQWTFTEAVSGSGQPDEPVIKTGTASIYFTPDSVAVVVDEINGEGHRFRGIHTYDNVQNRYNNFSNRTDGGINWSHYRWDENSDKGIWYEAELTDPNNPENKVQLNSNQFYAEWGMIGEKGHRFRVIQTMPDGSKITRTVDYSRPGWHADQKEILSKREASNAALKSLDDDRYLDFLTHDVLITTGNGTLISGKDELVAYIASGSGTRAMYWIRTPDEITVNETRGLAWETGTWQGFYAGEENENEPVIQGNYSAQWILASNEWLIQSQLFVTIE